MAASVHSASTRFTTSGLPDSPRRLPSARSATSGARNTSSSLARCSGSGFGAAVSGSRGSFLPSRRDQNPMISRCRSRRRRRRKRSPRISWTRTSPSGSSLNLTSRHRAAAEQRTARLEDDVEAAADRREIELAVPRRPRSARRRDRGRRRSAGSARRRSSSKSMLHSSPSAEPAVARERDAAGERHTRHGRAVARVEIAKQECLGRALDLGVLARHTAGAQRQVAERIAAEHELRRRRTRRSAACRGA